MAVKTSLVAGIGANRAEALASARRGADELFGAGRWDEDGAAYADGLRTLVNLTVRHDATNE